MSFFGSLFGSGASQFMSSLSKFSLTKYLPQAASAAFGLIGGPLGGVLSAGMNLLSPMITNVFNKGIETIGNMGSTVIQTVANKAVEGVAKQATNLNIGLQTKLDSLRIYITGMSDMYPSNPFPNGLKPPNTFQNVQTDNFKNKMKVKNMSQEINIPAQTNLKAFQQAMDEQFENNQLSTFERAMEDEDMNNEDIYQQPITKRRRLN